ncbi:HpcH/HpaI aldolase/citrate lyase family protein [Microbacterium sp. NPDC058062]|uniref:HpcH/HpaI aldolase family protein n=1 Tax=Microbacterium sp. NPDC058062 TaxID=3346320 RepID=UPI0036DE4B23
MSLRLDPTMRDRLAAADRPLAGMWVSSGSPLVAEICAGSGLDWLLIDMEHAPNGLESVLAQLHAVAAYPITPVVRLPSADATVIKQVLDIGAQNLLIPMIESARAAQDVVDAARYPPRGGRGVGSALARSARWNRVDDYLQDASDHVAVFVQIESATGAAGAAEIARVDGIDGIFVGPSDLAASMGRLGQQAHPDVQGVVREVIEASVQGGTACGVNAFDPAVASAYLDQGVRFILVDADVSLLARSTERLASAWCSSPDSGTRLSY